MDSQKHGEGTFNWTDGTMYAGSWVGGKMEGYGVYFWPTGSKFSGEYKNDKKLRGTYYYHK